MIMYPFWKSMGKFRVPCGCALWGFLRTGSLGSMDCKIGMNASRTKDQLT